MSLVGDLEGEEDGIGFLRFAEALSQNNVAVVFIFISPVVVLLSIVWIGCLFLVSLCH